MRNMPVVSDCTLLILVALLLLFSPAARADTPRLVIVDQDASGPAGSDMQSIALLLKAPDVQVLGITVTSGDAWRDEEVAHALRLTEIMHRTDVPVVPGAVFPLVHTRAEVLQWQKSYGALVWYGAWMEKFPGSDHVTYHEPEVVPPLPEGMPTHEAANEIAADFLVRAVHAHPHQVSIIALGPLTDIALAIRLDPKFPQLAKELVFMGGSLNPALDTYFSAEFVNNPKHEFNLWWDPEAARIVLRAPWQKITCTPVDISLKTKYTPEIVSRMAKTSNDFTHYLQHYAQVNFPMWDELAVASWLDSAIITQRKQYFMDCDCDQGAAYGNTLSWVPGSQPGMGEQSVTVNTDLDNMRFSDLYVSLMQRPLPAVTISY